MQAGAARQARLAGVVRLTPHGQSCQAGRGVANGSCAATSDWWQDSSAASSGQAARGAGCATQPASGPVGSMAKLKQGR